MKWRKVKKHFKRYDRDKLIGLRVCVDNVYGVVTDVKIWPSGGKRVDYDFTAEPVIDEWHTDWAYNENANGAGHSITCELSFDVKDICMSTP